MIRNTSQWASSLVECGKLGKEDGYNGIDCPPSEDVGEESMQAYYNGQDIGSKEYAHDNG